MKLEFKEEKEIRLKTRQTARYKNLELRVVRDADGLVSYHFGPSPFCSPDVCSIHPEETWQDIALQCKEQLLVLLADVDSFLAEKELETSGITYKRWK